VNFVGLGVGVAMLIALRGCQGGQGSLILFVARVIINGSTGQVGLALHSDLVVIGFAFTTLQFIFFFANGRLVEMFSDDLSILTDLGNCHKLRKMHLFPKFSFIIDSRDAFHMRLSNKVIGFKRSSLMPPHPS
jgi:hypothetical protein